MVIHKLYIDNKIYQYGSVGDVVTLCTLPANATFIALEKDGDNTVVVYSTPSESEPTISVGSDGNVNW